MEAFAEDVKRLASLPPIISMVSIETKLVTVLSLKLQEESAKHRIAVLLYRRNDPRLLKRASTLLAAQKFRPYIEQHNKDLAPDTQALVSLAADRLKTVQGQAREWVGKWNGLSVAPYSNEMREDVKWALEIWDKAVRNLKTMLFLLADADAELWGMVVEGLRREWPASMGRVVE